MYFPAHWPLTCASTRSAWCTCLSPARWLAELPRRSDSRTCCFFLCLSHESVALESLENGALDEDRQRAARKDGRPRATQVKDSCKGERIVAPQEKRPGKDKDERPRSPHFSDEAESGFDQIDAEPQVQQGGDEEDSLAYKQSENLFLCVLPRGARAGCLLPPLITEEKEMADTPRVFVSTEAVGISPRKPCFNVSLRASSNLPITNVAMMAACHPTQNFCR